MPQLQALPVAARPAVAQDAGITGAPASVALSPCHPTPNPVPDGAHTVLQSGLSSDPRARLRQAGRQSSAMLPIAALEAQWGVLPSSSAVVPRRQLFPLADQHLAAGPGHCAAVLGSRLSLFFLWI